MNPAATRPPVLQVIIGSTRPGRAGLAVGRWIAEYTRNHGGFTVEIVELAEVALPMLDEPQHPETRAYEKEHTRKYRRQLWVTSTPGGLRGTAGMAATGSAVLSPGCYGRPRRDGAACRWSRARRE
jgi:hypothetical protein